MDLLFHLQELKILPQELDFLEVQSCYQEHFEKNKKTLLKMLKSQTVLNFISANYSVLDESSKKYDLIVCNPPYFRLGQGLLSSSDFKNRCRFLLDSDFPRLIKAIDFSLKEDGYAFILLKSLAEHGIDIETEFSQLGASLRFKKLGLIRNTDLYQLTKSIIL